MIQKQTETSNTDENVDAPPPYVPPFMSKSMLITQQFAWERNRYWVPSPVVVDTAIMIKRCVERLGLTYE